MSPSTISIKPLQTAILSYHILTRKFSEFVLAILAPPSFNCKMQEVWSYLKSTGLQKKTVYELLTRLLKVPEDFEET